MLPVLQSVFVILGKQIQNEYLFYPDITKCVQMWSLFVWCAWGEWEHLSFRHLREYCIHCFSNPLSCQGLSSQDKDYVMGHFDPSKYNIQVGYGADSLKMFVLSFSVEISEVNRKHSHVKHWIWCSIFFFFRVAHLKLFQYLSFCQCSRIQLMLQTVADRFSNFQGLKNVDSPTLYVHYFIIFMCVYFYSFINM